MIVRVTAGLAILCFTGLSLMVSTAWAGDDVVPPHHTFGGQVVFWAGALIIVWLMARQMFKEQFHERRIIRRLVNEIGPFYPELDPQRIEQWVSLCAPHIWNSWNSGQLPKIDHYITQTYRDCLQSELEEQARQRGTRRCRLVKILKVHTIGIHMIGPGPAPRDLELILRVEAKTEDVTRDSEGKVLSGSEKPRQVQHFWSLRHDGHRLFLNGLWEAQGEMTDLAKRDQPPPVNEWERPESSAGRPTS